MQQMAIAVKNIVQGRNPRTYFDPAEMAEMEQSVAAKGVIQPILVRPVDDGKFQIVAGERRWRAAKKVKGEEFEIPALVKEMTDEEADEAALIENILRANMSPAEESEGAAKVLGRCSGDRDEAARRLGWSRQTLDSRLALMNCSEEVRKALTERKIKLGHAELLAAAPKERQNKALQNVLGAAVLPTVAELKAALASIARALGSAIFDKADCASCQYNSGTQKAMFSESIDAGACTNGECFDRKTEAALMATAEGLKDEFPVVRIARAGENFTLLPLRADGATGVGEDQAKACRACQNFGAAVSAVPDKLGKVYKELCFDAACNSKKVAERIKSEKAAAEKTSTEKPAAAAAGKTGASTKAKSSAASAAKKTEATVQDSNRVKEFRVKVWRNVCYKELMSNPAKNLIALIALGTTGHANHVASQKMRSALGKLTGKTTSSFTDVAVVAATLEEAGEETITKMHQGLVASATAAIDEQTLISFLKWLKADLTVHWKLNKEYLELLTKSEIEVIADELGIKAAVGEKFSKLMAGKKEEIIKALLEVEGFDYAGKVPAQLFWK